MTNAIRAIEGREKTLLTALNNLTTTVCNLQNQQCATCKTVCDLSATISGAASVTKSLVHDGEDHGKTNDGESDGVAMYDDVGVVVTVQDHIEKNVDMPPESSSPTDSSSPPVNRIMVPASPMPTMKKREVCKLKVVSYCNTIVCLSDELLNSYDVNIWEPGDHQRNQGKLNSVDQHSRKIIFNRTVQELQSGSMPDDIANDSLAEVVKIATAASSKALAHSMDVATSYAAPILQLRGTPLAPDDTAGTLSDTPSVASSFAEVAPSQIGK